MPYAEGTEVSAGRSREDIERTLLRYGASGFAYGWEGDKASVMFAANDRRIRFVLTMPSMSDFALTPTGRERSRTQQVAEYEKETRRQWRALLLVIKAKLEAVESGISEFEEEFLAHIVLPDGTSVGNWIRPQIQQSYASGHMPPLLALGQGDP